MSSNDNTIVNAQRTADEPVYLGENRYGEPKEMFKLVASLIESERRSGGHLADFGCATGEFLYYLRQFFPAFRFSGFDVSEAMLARGREVMPDIHFAQASLLDADHCRQVQADVVTCVGVLTIIDDIDTALRNLASALRPGGSLYIFNAINPYPIDVMVRYRPSGSDGAWELGRNLHSKATIDRVLEQACPGVRLTWHRFDLPFDIAERDDPMRTWTIQTDRNPRQLVNGACQLVNLECLQAILPA